jgi:hypothetical protein
MLRIAVSWYQQHAGVSFSLFDDVHTPIPYSAARWLHSLRTFLATIDGQLELDDTYVTIPQRQHDTHLMDLVVTPEAFSPEIQAILNHCRLSLNVITISDISNAAGTHLIPGVEWGEMEQFPSTSNHHETIQPRPEVFFWIYWQRLLHIIAHPDGTLRTPLGPWLHDGSTLRRTWNTYFDIRYNFLYRQTPEGWTQYELFDTRFLNGIHRDWTPTQSSVPVTIEQLSRDCWQLTHPPSIIYHPSPVLIPATLHEYLAQLPSWEHHLFADLILLYEPYDILQRINLRPLTIADALFTPSTPNDDGTPTHDDPIWKLLMVSDGSESSMKMTFGWALCLHDGTRLAYCSGPAFGRGSSHRAEATGMLSGARFLHHLALFCNQPIHRPTTFTSDNKGLLTRITQRSQYAYNYATATLAPDWDLIDELHNALDHFTQPTPFTHVLGHQDDKKKYADLSLDAQLNVDADHEAGNYQWNYPPTVRDQVPLTPTTRVHLHIQHRTITGHYRHHIRTAASQDEFFQQCREIHEWTPAVFDLIHLPTLRSAVRNNPNRLTHTFKFLHGVLPTQKTKAVWYGSNPCCPVCLEDDNQAHFFHCCHPTAQTWRNTLLRTTRTKLDTLHTPHELQVVLIEALEAWLDGERIDPRGYPSIYRAALTAQNMIGWHSFLRGYWSSHWITLQDAHLKRTHAYTHKMTGKIWATRIIVHIWDQVQAGWKLHNDKVHSKNATLDDADIRRRTIAKIYHLHRLRRKVLHDHIDHLFLTDVRTTIRTSTLKYLQNWIRLYEPSIHESVRTAQSQAIRHTHSLTTYFHMLPRKRPPKPRFDQRTRLLRDGRQKTRKRTKPLPNPTRNRITRYFRMRPRQPTLPRQTLPLRHAPRPINPYLPHHLTTNPYPSIVDPTPLPPAPAPALPTPPPTPPPLGSPLSTRRTVNPYAPFHVSRNPYRLPTPAVPPSSPAPPTSPLLRPPPPLPIRNPYARKP